MDNDIMKMIREMANQLVSNDAPTKKFVGCKYMITVSPNPNKLSVQNLDNGKITHIDDLNELEISLLALISSLCMTYNLY